MMPRTLAALFACLALLVGFATTQAHAAAQAVSIDIPNLRCIQTRTPGEGKSDEVYLLVHGVVKGKAANSNIPAKGTLKATPKIMPINEKKNAQNLWKGELADGEFAFFTVTLMQANADGKGASKAFTDAVAGALNAVEARGKKTLTAAEYKSLAKDTQKGLHKLVVGVKKLTGRDTKTDHFGGMFSILVWNNGGEVQKRVDPVGLTFGEHYGIDVKTYTKLKYTLDNVLYQDSNGEWYAYQLGPVSDDELTLRPKCLEVEMIDSASGKVRNVHDYLFDVQVKVKGEAQLWELAGEVPGETIVHDYWNWAE